MVSQPTPEEEQRLRERRRAIGAAIIDMMAVAGASMCGYPMTLPDDEAQAGLDNAIDNRTGQDDRHSGPSLR
jgi:hypothetical protein